MARPSRNGRRPKAAGTAPRLMVLSSAVIVAAYAVGYAHTEAAARQATILPPALTQSAGTGAAPAASSASQTSATSSASGSGTGTAASATSAGAASSTNSTTPKATPTKYRNGTFTAQGWGLHGPITVAVVIQGGRIVSANVTQCGTTYPCAYISPLVGEVVQNQGPPTDYVSGATASSDAYYQAVTQALAQA